VVHRTHGYHPSLVFRGSRDNHEVRHTCDIYFSYYIQHCFICHPSDSTVPTDARIEPGPLQLVHWQSDALTTRLDLIRTIG
jgi:hypothetical protein